MAAIALVALFYAIAVLAPDPATLFVVLLPVGMVIGCVEIMVNTEADRAEYLLGYRIMNRAPAFWSIGFFSAGLFGAQLAAYGISPQVQLAINVPIVAVATGGVRDRAATLNISALAQFLVMMFLLGPPVLGFVAQTLGIRTAFGIALPPRARWGARGDG